MVNNHSVSSFNKLQCPLCTWFFLSNYHCCLRFTSTHAHKHTQHTPMDVPEPTHGNNPLPHPTPAVHLPSNSPLWLIYRLHVKWEVIFRSCLCFQNFQNSCICIMETLNLSPMSMFFICGLVSRMQCATTGSCLLFYSSQTHMQTRVIMQSFYIQIKGKLC